MFDNCLTLFCLVDGKATPNGFPVEIEPGKTAGSLKNAIKLEQTPDFDDITASSLTLWRVTIPVDSVDKREPIFLNNFDSTELDPTDKLSEVFKETLLEKTIYIIVQRPPGNAAA